MRQTALFALSLLVGFFALFASAGEYNTTLSIGDAAPAWSELPGVDGKPHSLADLKEKEFVAVVFTCNSCPYAVDYEDRLIEFARKHGGDEGKVALVAINVNAVPEDSFPKMQERAKERGFNFPYLYDESQKIAKAYGATRTPEFFLLDANRKVVYMGAMDDNADASQVKANYLERAIAAVRAGEKASPAETLPVGCAVRYARQRRTAKQ
jgi:peroxiredoxin